MTLKDKYEKLGQLAKQMRGLTDAADGREGDEKGVLTAEENEQFEKLEAAYDKLRTEVEADEKNAARRKRLDDHEQFMLASAGRLSQPETPAARSREQRDEPTVIKVAGHEITIAPDSLLATVMTPEYRRAFATYLGTGIQSGLQTTSNPQGGYLAPTQTATDLIRYLQDEVFMRGLGTVLPPLASAVSLGVPTLETDPGDADWTAEVPASDISEDTDMALGKRELSPHLATKLIKVSMKLLRVSVVPVEALIRERLGYKFAVTEEKGFLTGSGAQQPLGIFTASNDGIPTTRDTTAASETVFTADELIDTLYALKGAYQQRSTWVLHRDAVKRVRKMKDGEGQYLWSPGLVSGQPDTILGRPYQMSEFAPNTFTTGNYVAVVGDMRAYWIVDSLQLELQRLDESFALRNQIGLLGRKETDGMPVLAEAFSRLVLA